MLLAVQLCALLTATNPYLSESRQLYESLRYEKAISRLELARKVNSNTPEERREILDLLARSYAALGQMEQAEDAYAELLAKDPHSPDPVDAAPKIRLTFEKAKERLYPADYVKLRSEPAPEGEVAVNVVDPWGQVTTMVLFEGTEGGDFHEQAMKYESHRAQASFVNKDPPHRYFVEARALDGDVRARLGSSEKPIVIELRKVQPKIIEISPLPEEPPPHGPRPTWVPWTVAGLAAGALAVGTVYAVQANQDSVNAGRAPYADDTARLDARAHDRAVAANWLIGGGVVAGGAAAVLFFTW